VTRIGRLAIVAGTGLTLVSCSRSTNPQSSAPRNALPSSVFVSKTIPETKVGAQLKWLLGAIDDLPLAQSVIESHFDSVFLSQVSRNKLNTGLAQVSGSGEMSFDGILNQTPTALAAVATFGTGEWKITMSVDSAGLIAGLLLAPYIYASATTWTEIDKTLTGLAPNVGFLAARVSPSGTCTPIHQLNSSTARPLASQFKLFVLGALAEQIASGHISWNQTLTVQDSSKSIGNAPGSGSLQFSPAGTKVTVQETATKMISISDNTAADMLIGLLGRPEVEAQVRKLSTNPSADEPFLTTREAVLLHYANYPTLANEYLALAPIKRSSFLASSVDPLPLSDVQESREPRDIDSIEWFGSPRDVCRAFSGLQVLSAKSGLSALGSILSLNSGGIGLDPSKWPSVWFKGGSEPGVLTVGYLAKDSEGQTYVVTAMLSNPNSALSPSAVFRVLAAVKAAFGLVT
jgi:hypothetical protein